ncbi:hypothetical protein C0J52_07409 [Blattella germanica]|nr:hypothetical protein C0J52_07409 [Blattella germanica]
MKKSSRDKYGKRTGYDSSQNFEIERPGYISRKRTVLIFTIFALKHCLDFLRYGKVSEKNMGEKVEKICRVCTSTLYEVEADRSMNNIIGILCTEY